MAGQAKMRGTFEQRKTQAITAGCIKKTNRRNAPPPQLEDLHKPIEEPVLCATPSPGYMQALAHILELSNRRVVLIGPNSDHIGLEVRLR